MILDPVAEFEHLVKWSAKQIGKTLTVFKLTRNLARHLNKRHPVLIRVEKCPELSRGHFTVGALYEPSYDEWGRKPLVILFVINQSPTRKWVITKKIVRQLNIEILEALIHEYQHLHQYRSREFLSGVAYKSLHVDSDIRLEQMYLGNKDEIDAYAANIAARFFVLRRITDIRKASNTDLGNDLDMYYRVFGVGHPIVCRLIKKISKNLKVLHERDKKKALHDTGL